MRKTQSIGDAIHRLSRHSKRNRHCAPRSSKRYMRLLKLIQKNDGPKSSELAQWMEIQPGSLSEMLRKLEDDSLIVRERDENDKRAIRIYITPEGEEHINTHRQEEDTTYKGVLSEEEERIFLELCNKLIESIDGPCGHQCCKKNNC